MICFLTIESSEQGYFNPDTVEFLKKKVFAKGFPLESHPGR